MIREKYTKNYRLQKQNAKKPGIMEKVLSENFHIYERFMKEPNPVVFRSVP